jgi:Lipocalin-like domain
MPKSVFWPLVFLLATWPAHADDGAKLIGVWKLVSYETEVQDSGERRPDFGKSPAGYVIFTADRRVIGIIEAEGRAIPRTDADAARAFQTAVAYSGTYRLEGDTWTTRIDVATNPAWTGKDSVRTVKFEGDRMLVTSAWTPNPLLGGKITRNHLRWERVS